MKILVISRGIPSRDDPMWGNFELDQAKALKRLGHDVICMSVDKRRYRVSKKIGVEKKEIDDIVLYNIYYPIPFPALPRKIKNHLVNFLARRIFRIITRKHGSFDIIHAHYLPNIRIASFLKRIWNVPAVGTEHWSQLKKETMSKSVRKDAFESYHVLNQLITVSYPMKKIVEDNFSVKSEFVGCVVDDVFSFVPKQEDGIFRFISVGSLFKIKGFDTAIEAFSLAAFNKNVEYIIIGEGNERENLEQIILSKNLKDNVFLLGRMDRSKIMDWLGKSSAYVLSSKSENFATACMEALSSGVPAIMTKCGGPEDFVDESNAVLVNVDNIEEMARAMRFMVENSNQFNRKEISDNMKLNYSSEAIGQKLTKIYEKVTQNI